MSLIRLEKVSLAYGDKPLLADVDFVVEPGARLCLLGRNGEGKSTMMSVLRGDATPDVGDVIYDSGLKIGSLPQSLPPADDKRAFDLVTEAFGELGAALSEYQILTASQDVALSDAQLERMDTLQHIIEKADAWQYLNDISQILKRFGIAPETKMESLSGGWRRRVMLAKALVNQPDLLLLDEPTNHLDINTIRWLEEQLQTFQGAMLFVSHDRAFIKSLAAQILELDRGRLRHFRGSYTDYLAEKEKLLADEQTQNKLFDKKLSEEETWIRQGIKARRTRNEGRVRALKALREERKQRLDKQGKAALRIESASPSGKLVAEATDISFQYGNKTIVSGFSTTILRGDRIGLIGSNGAGKTTLLRILLGQLAPTAGQVRQGSKLEIAYFDQLRDGLDPEKTVIDSVADGHEYVTLSGRDRHVISYLNDFLFTSQRARSPVKSLSGGETNRLLLAKLFAKPANLIVMDEPTNDLDVDTLELLEEKLTEFDGTLLLTSHDRDFLDQVVTSTMVFKGDGKISEYVGGYDDWVRQTGGEMADESTFAQSSAKSQKSQMPDEVSAPPVKASQNATSKTPARKKLSYKLQRELEQLPALIEQLEESIEAQQALIAAPDFFSGAHELIEAETTKLSQLEAELAQAMDRWVELEEEANQ